MAAGDAPPNVPVPWGKLLQWVQEQLVVEKETDQPAALTRLQLEAISHLVSFNEEPEVGNQDYVSLLIQKVQILRLSNPVFADELPVSLPVDGHFQFRWRCVCTLAPYGVFPRDGFGFAAGQQAPLFQSKKTAKQFAAKHALAYLSDALQTLTPNLKKRPLQSSQAESPEPSPAGQAQQKKLSLSPGPPSTGGKQSIFEQVSIVVSRLGIDNPAYRIEPDPTGSGLFCGRPVFQNGGRIPSQVGVVSGIASETLAKQRIAELVLAWGEEEFQKRQRLLFKTLWGPATAKNMDKDKDKAAVVDAAQGVPGSGEAAK
ncbi:uncharacterized protein UV8b_03670 [Ustilaginoidea virens]|uniref:DRBM domain-containing protein n=1 Tax=Ustilaginoidea virens TaxID=1159556 RepID=A0A063BZN7_USTVR|nr:uncharacterized protein UV8b_03670 [Ustilaginoidea virens]QUC19429.1 hypothetical protein UV8b_03670 [Ustilaginoidea virens]GAO13255.1 hypothetical protein UVI_02026010 [Ustilaginoidea virens]